jgi:hypothetical protein
MVSSTVKSGSGFELLAQLAFNLAVPDSDWESL